MSRFTQSASEADVRNFVEKANEALNVLKGTSEAIGNKAVGNVTKYKQLISLKQVVDFKIQDIKRLLEAVEQGNVMQGYIDLFNEFVDSALKADKEIGVYLI